MPHGMLVTSNVHRIFKKSNTKKNIVSSMLIRKRNKARRKKIMLNIPKSGIKQIVYFRGIKEIVSGSRAEIHEIGDLDID